MGINIVIAKEDHEIQSCFPVMAELRPHVSANEFLGRVRKQIELAGYQLAYCADGEVKAVAGFRISECLAWGKFLYVDDLVSGSGDRRKGIVTNFIWIQECRDSRPIVSTWASGWTSRPITSV